MIKTKRSWSKIKENYFEFIRMLKQWYVLANQNKESQTAITTFRKGLKEFRNQPQISPHFEEGILSSEYKYCLYLHNLLFKTKEENKLYKEYLIYFTECDYEDDILELTKYLYMEYKNNGINFSPFAKEFETRLRCDAKRALNSLSAKQKEFIRSINCFDYIIELLASLVSSKMMLNYTIRNMKKKKIKVGLVIPVYEEISRLKKKNETLSGEDFFLLKRKQSELLLYDTPDNSIEILLFFVGDNNTCKELKKIHNDSIKADDNLKIYIEKNTIAKEYSKSSNVNFGFNCALENKCQLIGYSDADISTNLVQLGAMIYHIYNSESDAAIASRRLSESWVFGRDPFITYRSKVYNFLVRLFLGIPFMDTQVGFKLFTNQVVKELCDCAFQDNSMAFDTELLSYLTSKNHKIQEVPVVWFESPLESLSASLHTALDMFMGLSSQCRNTFISREDNSNEESDPLFLFKVDKNFRKNLIHIGINKEFNLLILFCIKYYELIEPVYLRNFLNSLKSLFYALSKNELNSDEFNEFIEISEKVIKEIRNSYILAYLQSRYPQILEIIHIFWVKPKLIKPVLCFFLGSTLTSKFLPEIPEAIPSFYMFCKNRGMNNNSTEHHSRIYELWIGLYKNSINEQINNNEQQTEKISFKDRRKKSWLPNTIGRRASTKKILNDGIGKGKTIHLIVPAIGTVIKNNFVWSAVRERPVSELSNMSKKLRSLDKLFEGVDFEDIPEFKFYFMTGFSSDMIDALNEEEHVLKELEASIPQQNKVSFSLYAIESSENNKTSFISYKLENSKLTKKSSIVVAHDNRKSLLKELSDSNMPKGVLLYAGFKVFFQENISENSVLGYTVTTLKIPIEEYIFLLKALADKRKRYKLKERTVVVGSRRLPDSEVLDKPLLNHFRSALLNLIIRSLFPDLEELADTQSTCKLLTTDIARDIFEGRDGGPFFSSYGLECDVEILQLAKYYNGYLEEVAISFYESLDIKENMGVSLGSDLITSLLKLRGRVPNVNQKPCLIENNEKKYTVEYISSGTENMVFKIDCEAKKPLVVKIPHEAIDTDFFLSIDSLCFNRLRSSGWTKVTGRTKQKGLILENVFIRKLFSLKKGDFSKWIFHLRNWNEFNTFIMKIIRAYEGKTFKSSGYKWGLGKHKFIVPFYILSADEGVDICWNSEKISFDGLDNVVIMEFIDNNIQKYLIEHCDTIFNNSDSNAQESKENIIKIFTQCIESVYSFLIKMAKESEIYDLDTNMWSDIGIYKFESGEIKDDNLRILDPGEIESLSKNDNKQQCIEILCDKLMVDKSKDLQKELIERIQNIEYRHSLFDNIFQFKLLNIFMDRYDFNEQEKKEIRNTCVDRMKKYLRTLVDICFSDTDSNDTINNKQGDIKNEWWCIYSKNEVNLLENKMRRYQRQKSFSILGSDLQGKFCNYTESKIQKSSLNDFNVFLSQRGLSVRSDNNIEVLNTNNIQNSYEYQGKILLLGRENIEIYNGLNNSPIKTYPIPKDHNGVPYRSGIVPVVNALKELENEHIKLVILNGGAAVRMSKISVTEGSKGDIQIQNKKLWKKAAEQYGRIAQEICNKRNDLVIIGASDTLFDIQPETIFFKELSQYFSMHDPLGQSPEIFLLQPISNNKNISIIPYSKDEQKSWLINLLSERYENMRHFVPFLHLFKKQISNFQNINEAGFGMWSQTNNSIHLPKPRSILPLRDYFIEYFRYELIANSILNYGGLRTPFLFIISKSVIDSLSKFFELLDAPSAYPLDWYNTFVVGFSSIAKSDFIKLHLKWMNLNQAKKLYNLLQQVKKEFWNDYHQILNYNISKLFNQELIDGKISWHAFESPVDIFNYYCLNTSKSDSNRNKNVEIITDNNQKEKVIVNIANQNLLNKVFKVVIVGNIPENSQLNLYLDLPNDDIAKKSNFYPYLIYIASNNSTLFDATLSLEAHDLCIIGNEINKLKLGNVSKKSTLKSDIFTLKNNKWQRTGIVEDLFKKID